MALKGMVPPDPETEVSQVRYAVVYAPRRGRKRFPAGCVELHADAAAALAAADPRQKRFAARVVGPSKSSEGLYVYYLDRWLD